MLAPIHKSSRFQEDYKRYKKMIDTLPDGNFKTEVSGLLIKLTNEVNKLDSMHTELVYTKQLPSLGNDFRENITSLRKQLESKLKDSQSPN